ncbi:MAG: hypothetical protein KME26_01440 [Oscillatoria princeps RMCB-10]|nr:hypothetical protein [Oscillatoria princeps RMCB-10]
MSSILSQICLPNRFYHPPARSQGSTGCTPTFSICGKKTQPVLWSKEQAVK